MGQAAVREKMTVAEYFAFDAASELRHEFIAGDVYAMGGGTAEHSAVKTNLIGLLFGLLRGGPCRPMDSDLRIQAIGDESCFYSDACIVCGGLEYAPGRKDTVTNPVVVFEVLSPSTADFDRGTKFRHHRQIRSLKGYVLVDPVEKAVELWTRQADGAWTLRDVEGCLVLECVGIELPLAELFELEGVR